jgi:hypothetical protein
VAQHGLDGNGPANGPSSAGPNSGQVTVPQSGTGGTWADETDIRPTLMALTGLQDDYVHDGRVITEVAGQGPIALRDLGACYKQLNSSVGRFGTDTLMAATAGIESTTPLDQQYHSTTQQLSNLLQQRDALAGQIKSLLDGASFGGQHPDHGTVDGLTQQCNDLLGAADALTH